MTQEIDPDRLEDRIRVVEKYARSMRDEAEEIMRLCQQARREISVEPIEMVRVPITQGVAA